MQDALSAESNGVDVPSINSLEFVRRPGEYEVDGLTLIPRAARELRTPMIARRTPARGRSMAEVFEMGADDLNVGLRFGAAIHARVRWLLIPTNQREISGGRRGDIISDFAAFKEHKVCQCREVVG